MRKKIAEWFSVQVAKRPGRMVIGAILLFNIVFFIFSAVVISSLSLEGTEKMGVLEAAFCTITMILDAGCVQFVIADIGKSGAAIAIICLLIIIIGMISFTGAVIGYITNFISNFISNSNAGLKRLKISDHIVILNWNTRASEIVNDLMYCGDKQQVVVLVQGRKKEIEKEIQERLADTIVKENRDLEREYAQYGFLKQKFLLHKYAFKKNIDIIVREGDVFSSKQLRDISLERARSVIILGSDITNTVCKFEYKDRAEIRSKGNSQTIKTLMQVADITAAEQSADNQKIIVEILDDWTDEIVDKIIKRKQVDGKCNIVPLKVNQRLGQILSQFSLMPELNLVYKELFSNKGAAFYSIQSPMMEDIPYISAYFKNHQHAIPLTHMESKGKSYCYYAAEKEEDIFITSEFGYIDYQMPLNHDYWIEQKNIIILGHNSRSEEIMQGFAAFRTEWGYQDSDEEIVKIVVIDDEKHLKERNYYQQYPFVVKTEVADIYNRETICNAITEFVEANTEDTSILILSDDSVLNEDIDANALTNLVYVQDIINHKIETEPDFDPESVDVIVEIIDPKHHDIVSSYSVNNVVISNRYISKMITQIGEKEAIYDFYNDILTYDTDISDGYTSKEIYVKKVSHLFNELPKPCTADVFIRALYEASVHDSLPDHKKNPTIALGYVKPGGKMILFSGNQSEVMVELEERDKVIVFSNH